MSPVQIRTLLHYYAIGEEPVDARRLQCVVTDLLQWGLLEPHIPEGDANALWQCTEKGRFYVEQLCALPLPIMKWVMPE